MRACLSWLFTVAAIGCALAVARGQERPIGAAVGAEQPATERPPSVASQPPASASAESLAPVAGPPAQASPLDTFLLRDSKGNLVPVLGMPFEEFEQLLRAKKGLSAPTTPSYVIESLSLAGTADEQTANLETTATIHVRDEGWVRVPLGLTTAVMRQPPKHDGPGEYFLAYDGAAGGFVCWLKGSGPRRHVVTLEIAGQLHRIGDERRLSIALPRATESSLRMTTTGSRIEVSLLAGEGIATARAAGDDRTEISVLGPAGELQLAWRPGREPAARGSGQFDASGEITVRVESQHRITSDAKLRVRSLGGPLEAFRVRLPPGMEFVAAPATGGLTVTPVGTSSKGAASMQVVEVRLDKPTTNTAEVVLRASRQAEAVGTMIPARFEVLGGARQRGTIDFTMDGEWQLDWSEEPAAHRLDLTPDTAAARIVARFEYFRQPCPLELKVSPRPSRVSVEPTHIVYVDPQRVRVETMLRYRFRGARAKGLGFEMGDWVFDRLTPDALLDVPVVNSPGAGPLEVPLRPGAAPPTELELKLEAHRVVAPGTEHLSLTFPRPTADVVAPATIMIVAADNIELTPQAAELVGLSADATSVRIPGRQQSPLVYRDLGGGEPASFTALLRMLPRTTATSGRANARIDRTQVQVEQKLDYRILHEPQRTFRLVAPRELAAGGSLQVWLGGEPLVLGPPVDGKAASSALARMEFSTPTDMIGEFQISVRYALPLRWDDQKPQALAIPLVLPVDEGDDDQFTGQQLEFALADGMQIEPDAESDGELAQAVTTAGANGHYAWSRPPNVSLWKLESLQGAKAAAIHVSQVWVQTWLAPLIRQDRVAMRLSTLQETVRIRLPKGVKQSSVLAAVDAHEATHRFYDPGVLVVTLPATALGRECVLEISYSLDPPEAQLGFAHDTLRAAQIDTAAPRRVYWQLALPENEHLLLPPGELAPEMSWSAERWLLARRPIMDQRQLEAWIKASRQEPLPRGVNEYLFGTLGRWPTLSLTSAQRPLVLSVASAGVLLLGLMLIHVPQIRRPWLLLGVATLVGAGALIAPDFALLAGQGAVLGLLITLVAAAASWLLSGRTLLSAGPVSTIVHGPRDTPSSQPTVLRPERSSRIGSTAPGAAPAMEVRP